MKKKREIKILTTNFEPKKGEVPFSAYPRPTLRRDSYFCLNGTWEFFAEEKGQRIPLGQITVPFPPESRLSGIERTTRREEVLIYERSFFLPKNFKGHRILLHFGAVDQEAEVWLNGGRIGSHKGGYLPFSFDVTHKLKEGENRLTVRVQDPMDTALPYGKQSLHPGGMWYTGISGIWQTVWMESVPEDAFESIRIQTGLDRAELFITGGKEKKRLLLQEENALREFNFTGDRITLTFPQPHNWSPEDPFLYRFTLISGEDRVESYFALRTISLEKQNGKSLLCLNGKPYYFHGLLDQGYFPDGIFLPGSPEGFREDIITAKKCGFNMLRKHIKLEPELFYYECDRLGMAVFQDFINAGSYSFFRDTALPNLGIKRGIRQTIPEETKKQFLTTAKGIQSVLYNHPSVLYYTVFNEGWGQFDADACYEVFQKEDPSRIYDTTSGWFSETRSDVKSEHVYFKSIKLRGEAEKALVLSEFGGYSCKIPGHVFSPKGSYGYRFFRDTASFRKALIRLYEKEILPLIKEGLCATVLTQLSDVEEEINGLVTYDRRVLKVDEKEMQQLAKKLSDAFFTVTSP